MHRNETEQLVPPKQEEHPMKRLVLICLLVVLTGCAGSSRTGFAGSSRTRCLNYGFRSVCLNYGFTEGTPEFAQCVKQETLRYRSACKAQGRATQSVFPQMPNFGPIMGGVGNWPVPSFNLRLR